jgi:hypothetical protein
VSGQQEIMLRFAFAQNAAGAAAAIALLKSLKGELKTYIPALQKELGNMKAFIPISARLAFECGIRGNECLLSWTRSAIAAYEKETKRGRQ